MEDQPGPLEAVADDGEEEFPLRPEQLEQVRLRDADGPRDRLGRGADVAALGELVDRGDDDRVATFVGGLACAGRGGGCVHARNLVSTK